MTNIGTDKRIISILGIDFVPLTDNGRDFINGNLISLKDQGSVDFDFFLLSASYLNKDFSRTTIPLTYSDSDWNVDSICALLVQLIYTHDSSSTVCNSFKKKSFVDVDSNTQYYAEFKAEGETKLMFFSPWYLKMRPRDDRVKNVVGDVFCLITSDSLFTDQQNSIEDEVNNFVQLFSALYIIGVLILGFIFANCISNRYSGIVTKQILDTSKRIIELQDKKKQLANEAKSDFDIKVKSEKDSSITIKTNNECQNIISILQEFVEMSCPHFQSSSSKDYDQNRLLKYNLMRQYYNKSEDSTHFNEKILSEGRSHTYCIHYYLIAENEKDLEKRKKRFEFAAEVFDDSIIKLSSSDFSVGDTEKPLDLKTAQIFQIMSNIKRKPTKLNKYDNEIDALKQTLESSDESQSTKIHTQLL